jgi:type II secretory pathway component PulF
MTPEEELQRAARAETILGDSLFKEAVEAVEEALLNGIKLSPIKDAELREKLCQQYIQLGAVVGQLRSYMETGKLAEATINQQRSFAERLKSVVNW